MMLLLMSEIQNTINNFFFSIWVGIRDFFVTILVYIYVFAHKWFPILRYSSIGIGVLLLITVYGAKKIRQHAMFTFILLIPLVLGIVYYGLAIGLSFYSVSH